MFNLPNHQMYMRLMRRIKTHVPFFLTKCFLSISHEPKPEPDDSFSSSFLHLGHFLFALLHVLWYFIFSFLPLSFFYQLLSFLTRGDKKKKKIHNTIFLSGSRVRCWKWNWKYFFVQQLFLVLAAVFLRVLFSRFVLIFIVLLLLTTTAGAPFFSTAL